MLEESEIWMVGVEIQTTVLQKMGVVEQQAIVQTIIVFPGGHEGSSYAWNVVEMSGQ